MVKKKSVSYYWKVACISLISLIVIGIGVGGYMACQPGKDITKTESIVSKEDDYVQISINRNQAMTLISDYLNQTIGKDNINFQFELNQQAELKGTFNKLPLPVDFSLYFQPIVLDNGNIKLKATQLKIGALRLPIRVILGFINETMKLPDVVAIYPKDKEIILELNQLELSHRIKVMAKDIDLQNDRLTFNIDLPSKSNNEK